MNAYPAVLYVEDDPKSRKVMKMCLEIRLGLSNITLLEDSATFIDRLSDVVPPPDIIFLDIHVQPLNGFEMLSLIRQNPAFDSVPVIALTASVMGEEVQRLRQHGFTGCLAKPLDLDRFPMTLQQILNGDTVWYITN